MHFIIHCCWWVLYLYFGWQPWARSPWHWAPLAHDWWFHILTVQHQRSCRWKVCTYVHANKDDTGAAVSIIFESKQQQYFLMLHCRALHYKWERTKVSQCQWRAAWTSSSTCVAWRPHHGGWRQAERVREKLATASPFGLGYDSNKLTLKLEPLLAHHASVLRDELGTTSPLKAKLHMHPDVMAKFWKKWLAPCPTKLAIKNELDHLEASGIFNIVSYSEWAAPIVAGLKDSKIDIRGDYC